MKLLSLLFLLASSAAFAGNGSSNVSSVKIYGGINAYVGGITVPDSDTTRFAIFAGVNAAAAGSFYPFYKGGAQYQVTAGNSAHCDQLMYTESGSGDKFQLVSSQTVYAAAATSITSGAYQMGAAATYGIVASGAGANVYSTMSVPYVFPASSYPGIQTNAAVYYNVIYICYETTP